MIMFCQVSATSIIYYLTSEEQVCGVFFYLYGCNA